METLVGQFLVEEAGSSGAVSGSKKKAGPIGALSGWEILQEENGLQHHSSPMGCGLNIWFILGVCLSSLSLCISLHLSPSPSLYLSLSLSLSLSWKRFWQLQNFGKTLIPNLWIAFWGPSHVHVVKGLAFFAKHSPSNLTLGHSHLEQQKLVGVFLSTSLLESQSYKPLQYIYHVVFHLAVSPSSAQCMCAIYLESFRFMAWLLAISSMICTWWLYLLPC